MNKQRMAAAGRALVNPPFAAQLSPLHFAAHAAAAEAAAAAADLACPMPTS
jgi:hypothetical protein